MISSSQFKVPANKPNQTPLQTTKQTSLNRKDIQIGNEPADEVSFDFENNFSGGFADDSVSFVGGTDGKVVLLWDMLKVCKSIKFFFKF